MENIKYKTYTKEQMLNIIQKKGFVFVDTNLGEHFIIKISDIPDFIMLESVRTGYATELTMYVPGIEKPILTTFGCFLNKVNPLLRNEIINRLFLLQTTDEKPKKVKVFNNDIFINFSPKEKGIENGKVKNFDKFYKKYVLA